MKSFIMKELYSVLMVLFIIQISNSENILAVFHVPFKSHYHTYKGFLKELSLRGHNVTVLAPFATNQKYQNFSEHKIGSSEKVNFITDEFLRKTKLGSFKREAGSFTNRILMQLPGIIQMQMQTPGIKEIIENSRFDLVFFEWLCYHPLSSVVLKLNIPIIGVSSMDPHYLSHDSVGNPTHPILSPDPQLPFPAKLNFAQKLESVFYNFYIRYVVINKLIPIFDNILRNTYGTSYPYLGDSIYKIDLLFINKHEIFTGIRPNVPAIINVGSLHLKSKEPLPLDLQTFLDNSEEGVVYFSLGSAINCTLLSEEIIQTFVRAFTALPYQILWKWDSDILPVISDNIKYIKWAPQQDLLGHPNIKCFLNQGGQQSLQEAIDNEVPVIAIPFYGDQINNAIKISEKNIGISLDIDTISKNSINDAIFEIVKNPSYKKNIQRLKILINDQPMNSMERAIWWTEYVLRHNGASHLRAPAVETPYYEYFMLDVAAFVLAIVTIFLTILFFAVKYISRNLSLKLRSLKLILKKKIN